MKKQATKKSAVNKKPYVIIRDDRAGVFAGYLASRKGREVVLSNARRLWYWDGAASLSQLAMEGVKKPENCKFPCEVNSVTLFQVIELLPTTTIAQKSIAEVPVWKR
jgi:hypothetical protein